MPIPVFGDYYALPMYFQFANSVTESAVYDATSFSMLLAAIGAYMGWLVNFVRDQVGLGVNQQLAESMGGFAGTVAIMGVLVVSFSVGW